MNFSSLLLLEMKLGLHDIRLKPRDSPNSSITPVHLQPKSSKPHISTKKSVFWDYKDIILNEYLPQGRPYLTQEGIVKP